MSSTTSKGLEDHRRQLKWVTADSCPRRRKTPSQHGGESRIRFRRSMYHCQSLQSRKNDVDVNEEHWQQDTDHIMCQSWWRRVMGWACVAANEMGFLMFVDVAWRILTCTGLQFLLILSQLLQKLMGQFFSWPRWTQTQNMLQKKTFSRQRNGIFFNDQVSHLILTQ